MYFDFYFLMVTSSNIEFPFDFEQVLMYVVFRTFVRLHVYGAVEVLFLNVTCRKMGNNEEHTTL